MPFARLKAHKTRILMTTTAGSQPTPHSTHIWCSPSFCAAPTAVGSLSNSHLEPTNRRGGPGGHPERPFQFFFPVVLFNLHEVDGLSAPPGNGARLRMRRTKHATRGPRPAARRPFQRLSAQLTSSMRTTMPCARARSVTTSAYPIPNLVSLLIEAGTEIRKRNTSRS